MQDWRSLFRQFRYNEIQYLELSPLEQAELLGGLRAIVPTTADENGIEKLVRFKRPCEIPERSVRAAAQILELGELEAELAGEPPSARDIWEEERDAAERHVGDVPEGEPEFGPQTDHTSEREPRSLDRVMLPREIVTEIDAMIPEDPTARYQVETLSREDHAREFRANLQSLDEVIYDTLQLAEDEQEKRWLDEALAKVAIHAFQAGRRLQMTWYKPMEADTIRGQNLLKSTKEGGEEASRRRRTTREWVIAEMKESLDRQLSTGKKPNITVAATKALADGHGTSVDGNRKIWGRYIKTGQS